MELVVIAAGAATRFIQSGIVQPKPLILYRDKPLFWWSAMSAVPSGVFSTLHFVVLREHIDKFSIDREILTYFKQAKIHVIENITRGAAETAAIVSDKLPKDASVAFLDCDLAFSFSDFSPFERLLNQDFQASLCTFNSINPAYSYVKFDKFGNVSGTLEKKVVSKFAIAGLYAFKSVEFFLDHFRLYKERCEYSEFFMSGVFNDVIDNGYKINTIFLSYHLSLGTPEELVIANMPTIKLPNWYEK
jgi:hypothetical protein